MVNQPSEPRLIVTSESGQDVSKMQGPAMRALRSGRTAWVEQRRHEQAQRAATRLLAKRRGLAWLGFGLACHPWPEGSAEPLHFGGGAS